MYLWFRQALKHVLCGNLCISNRYIRMPPAYVNGVSEAVFKMGMCLPAGPNVSDEDVKYIVETIMNALVRLI